MSLKPTFPVSTDAHMNFNSHFLHRSSYSYDLVDVFSVVSCPGLRLDPLGIVTGPIPLCRQRQITVTGTCTCTCACNGVDYNIIH